MNTMPQTMLNRTKPLKKQLYGLTEKNATQTVIIVQNEKYPDLLEEEVYESANILYAVDIGEGIEYAERFQADAFFLINSSDADEQLLQRILAREPLLQNMSYVRFSSTDRITKQIIDLL